MATQGPELHPKLERLYDEGADEEEEEEEEAEEGWDDWSSDGDDAASAGGLLCLFCSARFESSDALFAHCGSEHSFGFHKVVRELGLDLYGCIKLINFVRSKVAENKCWCCGNTFSCNRELCSHLHTEETFKIAGKVLWEDEAYLKPFMYDDSLLHSLFIDDDDEDCGTSLERGKHSVDKESLAELHESHANTTVDDGSAVNARFEKTSIGNTGKESIGLHSQEQSDRLLKIARANVAAREIKSADDNYFGSYSSFGIHREMLGDKVRTDAYKDALLGNPSLMHGATVLDVGCGTGILSLFAAKAGASKVVAVDGSAKMVSVATQVAKKNGLLADENMKGEQIQSSQVISVVHSKAEELNNVIQVPPNSFDVLVSEWMGYCLLYESMLSSVLYARDHFLKPGGAILPDTATILGAGFGKGGTCLPFWENVYGFDMSCIGKEVTAGSAHFPIVDIVASQDIVTETTILHSFDLATMRPSEMDFTASFELRPRECGAEKPRVAWCYGILLWFETGFTSRFCKDRSVVLTTSPFCTPTHWSQTIFTFQEPIAMTKDESVVGTSASVGTDQCPAVMISCRVSIVRASEHRSIDISIETTGISSNGRKRSWPVQIFNL